MKKIPLTKGKFAIVDDEDFPYLSRFKWKVGSSRSLDDRVYGAYHQIISMNGKTVTLSMSSFIVTKKANERIMHRNHDNFDFRKENLIAMMYGNAVHQKRKRKNTSSKYIGVCYNKNWGKWECYVTFRKKRIGLGGFDDEVTAAETYNKKALELYGEFARLNNLSK